MWSTLLNNSLLELLCPLQRSTNGGMASLRTPTFCLDHMKMLQYLELSSISNGLRLTMARLYPQAQDLAQFRGMQLPRHIRQVSGPQYDASPPRMSDFQRNVHTGELSYIITYLASTHNGYFTEATSTINAITRQDSENPSCQTKNHFGFGKAGIPRAAYDICRIQ